MLTDTISRWRKDRVNFEMQEGLVAGGWVCLLPHLSFQEIPEYLFKRLFLLVMTGELVGGWEGTEFLFGGRLEEAWYELTKGRLEMSIARNGGGGFLPG